MKRIIMTLMTLVLLAGAPLYAQDDETDTTDYSVWVTTQDFSSFRAGPSTAFERLAVIDPEVTLPAVGRTSNVGWVQVIYDGKPGWIFAPLLIWSGDVISLPVDGIVTTQFIRRATATGVTTRETPIYLDGVSPETQVIVLPQGTQVELTGRLGGDTRFFQFQILYQGRLYWVGSWNIRITEGNYRRLLDVAYIYPYGRLVRQLEDDVAATLGIYYQINNIWETLNRGESVSCGVVIPLAERDIPQGDVQRETLFQPSVIALDSAIADVNTAITRFEDVCGREDSFLEPAEVEEMLKLLDDAERNLLLGASFLEPLRSRNPLLRITGGS
jgi:hypothetical protein